MLKAVGVVYFGFTLGLLAQEAKLGTVTAEQRAPSIVEGTWYRDTKGIRGFKTFCQGRIFVTQVEQKSKNVVSHFSGLYAVRNGILHEKAIFCTGNWEKMRDDPREYKLVIEEGGKSFRQIYKDGNAEVWTRCPDE